MNQHTHKLSTASQNPCFRPKYWYVVSFNMESLSISFNMMKKLHYITITIIFGKYLPESRVATLVVLVAGSSVSKESSCHAGDLGSIPGFERSLPYPNFWTLPKISLILPCGHPNTPTPGPRKLPICSLSLVLPFLWFYNHAMIQYVIFCIWHFFHSVMFLKYIHFVEYVSKCF